MLDAKFFGGMAQRRRRNSGELDRKESLDNAVIGRDSFERLC